MSSTFNSKTDLVSTTSFTNKTSNKRLYYAAAVLIAIIIALSVALAVIAIKKSDSTEEKDNDSSTSSKTIFSTPACLQQYGPSPTHLEIANCVLDSYPLIDGHNDLPWQYFKNADNKVYSVDLNSDLRLLWPNVSIQTDIPRLRKGKLGAQFWACYVSCKTQYKDAVKRSLEQLDTIKKFVNKYPYIFRFVTTAQGILDAFADHKVGSLVGLEGGHSIDSSLANLRMFYDLGVRYMTVTHNCNPPWADNWKVDIDNSDEFGGLTEFGKIVIKEMNRLGMMVDLSHVAKSTMLAVLEVTQAPVMYSHTSVYAICNHYRNVQDDILQKTKENGGVVMVNFYDHYINCPPKNQSVATLSQVADHIDHIKNLIGVEHVGIGADYDGVPTMPVGLEDVSTYPDLFAELVRRGWSAEELKKLAGENIIRVFTRVEKVRDELSYLPPYEDLLPENEIKNTNCSAQL